MHELSVATELYRACRTEVEAQGGGRIALVSVDIGELSGVEPRLLNYAWSGVVAGGADAGAQLEQRWCAARQRCAACGPVADRQPGSWLRLCPTCALPLVVEGGEELEIRSIEFEDEMELTP